MGRPKNLANFPAPLLKTYKPTHIKKTNDLILAFFRFFLKPREAQGLPMPWDNLFLSIALRETLSVAAPGLGSRRGLGASQAPSFRPLAGFAKVES
ncbi:MAG: hypothetical protein VKN60_00130, partial [Cyanobacteriota bacterium]|nr:hypothetical protein [Cyanobacteriota bacterium]